jgi:hypothetical protein
VLGDVLLIDVLHEPLRFRFRLHGTNLVRRAGYDMTGKMVEELPGLENRAVLVARCHALIETRRPIVATHNRVVDGRRRRYEVVWMPLSSDATTIDMLMAGLVYLD